MHRVILASNSTSRKQALEGLHIPFEVIPSNIDEKQIRDPDPVVLAEKLARAKGEFIAQKEGGIIISADTFCTVNNAILEKPNTLDEAKNMLRLLTKYKAKAVTGFCYLDKKNTIDFSTAIVTEFTFRNLSETEIDYYVTNFPVLTWSAAFSPAHTEGMLLLDTISGDVSSFVYGLPMVKVVELLRKSGVLDT